MWALARLDEATKRRKKRDALKQSSSTLAVMAQPLNEDEDLRKLVELRREPAQNLARILELLKETAGFRRHAFKDKTLLE